MKIVTENGTWVVKAQWLGKERVVYTGTGPRALFHCCYYVRDNKEAT